MTNFWLEYLHYIAAIFGILVSISSFTLFLITYRYERKLKTAWRFVGFFMLACALFFLILERKSINFEIPALLIQTMAFFFIYRGVYSEPELGSLLKTGPVKKQKKFFKSVATLLSNIRRQMLILAVVVIVVLFSLGLVYWLLTEQFQLLLSYLAPVLEFISLIFIVLTIKIQVRRYRASKNKKLRILNFWPLLAYIFLAFRGLSYLFYRLPDTDIVALYQQTLNFSFSWIVGVICTLLGFIFLWMWARTFIKVRVLLKTYVVFLIITTIISSLGALVFTTLVFQIVEDNNLLLMEKGAQTEKLILEERAQSSFFASKTIANDDNIIINVRNNNYSSLDLKTNEYFENSNIDILRVYNKYGEIIASPSDPRDKGRVLNNDDLLIYTISEKKQVRSFENIPGVLAPIMVTRSLTPIMVGNSLIGVVETGYIFDNAFVDFSKEKIELDVTVFTGNKRSATTIRTQDGVSRWIGSQEEDEKITSQVLEQGNEYTGVVDRLGEIYYSAFTPVRDINEEIIGMISVGVPTYVLFENTRQQLISSFLILTIISLFIAGAGSYSLISKKSGK